MQTANMSAFISLQISFLRWRTSPIECQLGDDERTSRSPAKRSPKGPKETLLASRVNLRLICRLSLQPHHKNLYRGTEHTGAGLDVVRPESLI